MAGGRNLDYGRPGLIKKGPATGRKKSPPRPAPRVRVGRDRLPVEWMGRWPGGGRQTVSVFAS